MDLTIEQLNGALKLYQAQKDSGATAVATKPAEVAPLNPLAASQIESLFGNKQTVDALQGLLDQGSLKLPGAEPKPVAKEEAKPVAKTDEAVMGNEIRNWIGRIDGVAGQGMPWASAAIGGLLALVATEAIDGFAPPTGASVNPTNILLKGGLAWASMQFMPQYTGRTAAVVTSGILLFSVAREITPFEDFLQWLIAKVSSWIPAKTSNRLGNRGMVEINRGDPMMLGLGGGRGTIAESAQILPGFGGPGVDDMAGLFR